MHRDEKQSRRWLESRGWTVDDDAHTATHPDAARAIHVGGPYGWPVRAIKNEARHALGQRGDRANRAATVHRNTAATPPRVLAAA